MPQPGRSMVASVQFHVQQWINLVLYNSIYQNAVLLCLYRAFKFIYGLFDCSTELSRICSAKTPLDRLWDANGNVVSALVLDKHGGTLAYTIASPSIVSVAAGRRGSVQQSILSTASTLATENNQNGTMASTGTHGSDSARTSTDSNTAVSSSDQEKHDQNGQQSGLKQRQRRGTSLLPSESISTSSSFKMDLRESKTAAEMVYRIDRCILFSKQLTAERRELEAADCNAEQITQQILRKKRFPESGSPETIAAKKLQYALDRIASTHQLARDINQRVHTKYDSTNPAHERKLLLVSYQFDIHYVPPEVVGFWELLCPNKKLTERYTKQWTDIGFQGKDPATDFRGMGMLGLDDLVYYAKYYPMSSKQALECSNHETQWYSFAIVGINITAFAVQTLRTRQLQHYLFLNGTDKSVYHELYCYLFHRFNGYWMTLEPKPTVMDFERVFADFKLMMERQLMRRKLMMLRQDTKEMFGSPEIGSKTVQFAGGEDIHLQDRKTK
ncbi:ELMO domain-containing protein 1 [Podila humilis]|nr:ELMO domain-containing protein 1 [Podila humilis]